MNVTMVSALNWTFPCGQVAHEAHLIGGNKAESLIERTPIRRRVTERYDRVRLDSLKAAGARLDDGQPFKILSSLTAQANPVESLSSTH